MSTSAQHAEADGARACARGACAARASAALRGPRSRWRDAVELDLLDEGLLELGEALTHAHGRQTTTVDT